MYNKPFIGNNVQQTILSIMFNKLCIGNNVLHTILSVLCITN